jgi:hypothetical protein
MRTMSEIRDVDQPNFGSENTRLITKSDAADNASDGAGNTATSHKQRPASSFASKCLPCQDSPVDATGCAIDVYARATIFMSSFFVGPALLKLESEQAIDIAGCSAMTDESYNECAKASVEYTASSRRRC